VERLQFFGEMLAKGNCATCHMSRYRNPEWPARYHRRTALRLGHFFGTSPEFWLNLQSLYDLRLAEGKMGKALKALRTLQHWKGRQRRQSPHEAARG
jgi:hypothetical protein